MPEKQRKRGTSFKQEYQGAAARAKGRGRAPSMLHEPTKYMIPPQSKQDQGKYVIVFDLDETLVYAREGPLYARPGIDDLWALLNDTTEVIVWTAGLRAYAQAIVRNIDKGGVVKHCVYRHAKWFTGQAGYQKDLRVLGRDMDKTIIVENTPDCLRANLQNGIMVQDYEGGEEPDHTIPNLTNFFHCLVQSGKTVPQFVTSTPLLEQKSIQTDVGDFLKVYFLRIDTRAAGADVGVGRVNRDLGR